MNIAKIMQNKTFTNIATGMAGTVLVTTGLKAIGRPAFIYADKNSDKETKKYTAGKEFLYQILCLGITVGILPLFQAGGLKLAEKFIHNEPKLAKLSKQIKEASIFKKVSVFEAKLKKKKTAKELLIGYLKSKDPNRKIEINNSKLNTMNTVKGAIELGSLVGSILGLTIIAPLISHEILHPVMKYLGLNKKENNIGKPNDIFLADAKVPAQGNNVNAKV